MSKDIFKFKQGDQVREKLTGFVGHVTGRHEYFNGCIRYSLESYDSGQAKLLELSFDEDRLELVSNKKQTPAPAERTGGPRDHVTRAS
jgi:hypothetical protein